MLCPFPSAYSPRSPVSTLQEVCEGTVSVQFTSLRASQGFQTQAVFFLQSTRKICIYYLKKQTKPNQKPNLQLSLGFPWLLHHSQTFLGLGPDVSPHPLSSGLFILVMNFLPFTSKLLSPCLAPAAGHTSAQEPTFCSPPAPPPVTGKEEGERLCVSLQDSQPLLCLKQSNRTKKKKKQTQNNKITGDFYTPKP